MAFNGAGLFTRIYSWVTDAGNNLNVDATRMDTDTNDIAAGLSNCICKDGQTTVTANIPMNSKKFTGLAVGSSSGDSCTFGQLQAAAGVSVAAIGSGNTTITYSALNTYNYVLAGSTAVVITLPLLSACTTGAGFTFANLSAASITIQRQGSDVITGVNGLGGDVTSIVVKAGETIDLRTETTKWFVVGGTHSLNMGVSAGVLSGAKDLAAEAMYQRFPSGLIIQGIQIYANPQGAISVSWPIAFPNAFQVGVGTYNDTTGGTDGVINITNANTTGCSLYNSFAASRFIGLIVYGF